MMYHSKSHAIFFTHRPYIPNSQERDLVSHVLSYFCTTEPVPQLTYNLPIFPRLTPDNNKRTY